ncbi:MAG: hypothetical protein ACXWE6_07485 [Nitrososphaeraceae archaeon]
MEKIKKEVFDFLNGLNIMLYIIKNSMVRATTNEMIVNIFIFERLII